MNVLLLFAVIFARANRTKFVATHVENGDH